MISRADLYFWFAEVKPLYQAFDFVPRLLLRPHTKKRVLGEGCPTSRPLTQSCR